MEIAERIKMIRKILKLSQKELSDSLGFSQSYICGVENGIKMPSTDFLVKFSSVFGVRLSWLSIGLGEIFSRNSKNAFQPIIAEAETLYNTFPHLNDFVSKLENGNFSSFQFLEYNMKPTLIPGDTLIINKNFTQIEHDKLFLLEFDGRKVVKRAVQMADGDFKITNDNPTVKNNDALFNSSILCLGRVDYIIRKFDKDN